MTLTPQEFKELLKQKGEPVLTRTTENYYMVPKGTKLWFGLNENDNISSHYDDTNGKNKGFNYDFSNMWYFTDDYTGKFELVKEPTEDKLIIHCPTEETDYKDHTFLTAQEYLGDKLKQYNYKPEQQAQSNNKPMLKQLTKTLKRVLSKDLQAQYRADYINGDLELTEQGKEELLRLLAVEKEKELADSAREYIKDCEKEDK